MKEESRIVAQPSIMEGGLYRRWVLCCLSEETRCYQTAAMGEYAESEEEHLDDYSV